MRLLIVSVVLPVAAMAASNVTFNKDVLPVLQNNCQSCHRTGEVAPMSFLTYESTRPWAKAIKAAVVAKKMPPWFADPRYGHFSNAPGLTAADIDTLSAWADNGSPEGNAKDKPAPKQWLEGWSIKPDVVVQLQEPFQVPAKGIIELTNIIVPSGFTKDTWITSLEIRPTDPAVVHHVVVSFRPHNPNVKYGVQEAPAKPRDENGDQINRRKASDEIVRLGRQNPSGAGLEAVYVPGGQPAVDYRLYDAAKLIPAGSDVIIGMHYTPNGKATTDQTRVGFTLAKEEPRHRFLTVLPMPLTDEDHFTIPPNDPNWESRSEVVFNQDAKLVWFMPHMHLRGKDMTYKLFYPNGETETVLSVPHYNFDWQLGYIVEKPIMVPKGTKLQATAHYDNSANNPFNPNPNKPVWWGDQTWEEMMVPWFGLVVDVEVGKNIISRATTQ